MLYSLLLEVDLVVSSYPNIPHGHIWQSVPDPPRDFFLLIGPRIVGIPGFKKICNREKRGPIELNKFSERSPTLSGEGT